MKPLHKILLFIFCIFICAAVNSQEVNTKAPDFQTADINGNTIKLSELKGRVVLMDFWASWCVPCKNQCRILLSLYNRTDSTFTVIAVNVDEERSKINEFANSLNIEFPFPIIFDKDIMLPTQYNVEGMPTTIIIDKEGIIRFKETGFTTEVKEKMDSKIKELLLK